MMRLFCVYFVFEVGELKYKEENDVPLARDLAKD